MENQSPFITRKSDFLYLLIFSCVTFDTWIQPPGGDKAVKTHREKKYLVGIKSESF